MNWRIAVGMAITTALVGAGCGSGDRVQTPETVPPATSAPARVDISEACPAIQTALDRDLDSDEYIDPAGYRAFARSIGDLVDLVTPGASQILVRLVEASEDVGATTDGPGFVSARSVWFDSMDEVTDVCRSAGAPLD